MANVTFDSIYKKKLATARNDVQSKAGLLEKLFNSGSLNKQAESLAKARASRDYNTQTNYTDTNRVSDILKSSRNTLSTDMARLSKSNQNLETARRVLDTGASFTPFVGQAYGLMKGATALGAKGYDLTQKGKTDAAGKILRDFMFVNNNDYNKMSSADKKRTNTQALINTALDTGFSALGANAAYKGAKAAGGAVKGLGVVINAAKQAPKQFFKTSAQNVGKNTLIGTTVGTGIGVASDISAGDKAGTVATNAISRIPETAWQAVKSSLFNEFANRVESPTIQPTTKSRLGDVIASKKAGIIASSPDVLKNVPKYNRVTDNEAYTLADYSEYLNPKSDYLKDIGNPAIIRQINKLSMQAHNTAKNAGVDIFSGSRLDKQDRIIDFLQQRDTQLKNGLEPFTPTETRVRQLTPEQVKAILKKEKQTGSIANPLYKGNKTKVTVKEVPAITPEVGKTLKDGELYSTANSYVSFGSDSTGGVISYSPKGTGSASERISYNKLSQKTRDELVSAELAYKNARANSTGHVAPGTVTEVQIAKGRLELAQSNAIEELGLQEHASIQGARLADGTKPTVQKPFLDRYTDWLENKWKSKEYSDAQIQDMEANPSKYKAQFESETSANSPEISQLQQKVDAARADLNNPQVDSRFAHEQLAKAQRELDQAHTQPTPQVTKTPALTPTKPVTPDTPFNPARVVEVDNATKMAIEDTASNYKTAKEYRDEMVNLIWQNNKKGQGVEFIMNNNAYEPGFDIKRMSNNTPFYREFFAEYGRKPTKTEITNLVDEYLSGKDNLMKYEMMPEERDVFNVISDNESRINSLTDQEPPEFLYQSPLERLLQPKKEINPIVEQVTSSRKVVEPNIAVDTKGKPVVKVPKSQPVSNKKAQAYDPIIAEKAQAEVKLNLQNKYDNFERSIYGDTTSDIQGGTKGAGVLQTQVRKGKEKYNQLLEKGLSSESDTIRRLSSGIRSLFGGAGDTAARITQKGEMRGGIDESINLANDFKKLGDEMLPDVVSRERVWAVLDPELAGKSIKESDLSPSEIKAVQTLRQASDLINDTNFSMNKISHEQWLAGRDGKYITRAYQEYDLPPELADSKILQPGKGKLDTGGYMKRKEVDEWKQENAIKDPFYLASKRIQSTFRNKAITDYANWINKQPNMISDVPRKGYTTLSDSKMWGDLAGKNIRHDALTDIKGFYSDNKALQGAYDFLNWYDRLTPRQTLKKTKTVFNPATRLGNQTSNRVFAAMNGINIAKFEWNMHKFAPQELSKNGKYARLLRKEGILGTDMTKYELVRQLAEDGVEPSKLKQISDKITSSYGAADDKAKLSAFKYWLDRGKTTDEALLKVRNGFQDYSKVGLLYDIGAKTPLVGKSFIRFQSELARIIKNSATENPLSLATVVGSIALMGELSSKLSGESEEDKKTREDRFGTPVIPFTQIPLVFQTPFGEINVARMFGMYETAGADTKNKNLIQRASKYLPFDIPTSKEDLVKSLGNDVLTGGVMNQVTDTDFRGKSISDPESNKYVKSTLTPSEQLANRVGAFYHNYQLPIVNSVEDVGRATLGLKDQYGKTKTPGQALSKLLGFKVEQFGPEQAAEQRAKDIIYSDYERQDVNKQINSVLKQQATGQIDAKTAQNRINNLRQGTGTTTTQSNKIFTNPNGGFSYIDKNGSLQTKKTEALAQLEIEKMDFADSDKNIKIVGDTVLRKTSDGDVQVMTKDSYDYKLGESKLTQYKRADNLGAWNEQANKQLDLLEKQLNDPNVDDLDKAELQNKAEALLNDMEKYQGYGGFKKGSSKSGGSKSGMSLSEIIAGNKAINATKQSSYSELLKLLMDTAQQSNGPQKAVLKQITVKK